MPRGVARRTIEPQSETAGTAGSPLGFILQTAHPVQPCLVVIVIIHTLYPERITVAHEFGLAQLILIAGHYIGVAEKYRDVQSVLYKTFQHRSGTGGATGMQEYPAFNRNFETQHGAKLEDFRLPAEYISPEPPEQHEHKQRP